MPTPPNQRNGLLPQQEAAFEAFLIKETNDAIAYIKTNSPAMPKLEAGKIYTTQQISQAHEKEKARPFFKEVKALLKASGGNENDPQFQASLAQLRTEKLEAAKNGMPKKSFMQIVGDNLPEMNPIKLVGDAFMGQGSFVGNILDSLKTALFDTIRNAAVSFGTESTAGYMKSVKDNAVTWWKTNSWGTETTEQATEALRLGSAAEALAGGMDKKSQAYADFVYSIREGVKATQPVATSAGVEKGSGRDGMTAEAKQKAVAEGRILSKEKTGYVKSDGKPGEKAAVGSIPLKPTSVAPMVSAVR